jgi:cytochrome c oxidase cbb3-type subunit 1
MMAVALVFYLLWALEGTALAVKSVSAVVGATDVVDAHVHSGALGWMGFMAFGALYCLAPRLCGRAEVYSLKLVEWHFWIATAGTVLYVGAMGAAGIQQGLMARAYGATAALEYSFVAMLQATQPFMLMRALGGALFVAGAVIMAYNLWMTVCLGDAETAARRAALQPAE